MSTKAPLRVVAWLQSTFAQERGQTLGEYALIISLIGFSIVVVGMVVFRTELAGAFDTTSNCLDTLSAGTSC